MLPKNIGLNGTPYEMPKQGDERPFEKEPPSLHTSCSPS